MSFIKCLEKRRSIYNLKNEIPVSDKEVEDIIKDCIIYTPTAFNSQNGRAVLLLKDNNNKLWDIVKSILKKITPIENFVKTEIKIDSFKSGYGTILFFEDMKTVRSLEEKYVLYKDNFAHWSREAIGMLQSNIWTALAEKQIGASLQHYNPLIDEEVKKTFDIPSDWKLVSQMPFGAIGEPAGAKEFMPIESRFRVIK